MKAQNQRNDEATCLLFVGLRDRPPENDSRVVGKK
jgi:hypothetical protein